MPFFLMRSMFYTLLTRYVLVSAFPLAAPSIETGTHPSGPA